MDTGGITSGRRTIVSTMLLSGHSLRANSHARPMPNGRISNVLASPTASEKSVICQVSSEKKFKQTSVSTVEKYSGRIPWFGDVFDLLFLSRMNC